MPKRQTTGNTKLVQTLITPEQFATIEKLAALRNTTVSEVMREQVRALVAKAAQLQLS